MQLVGRTLDVYAAIVNHTRSEGYTPSIRQIGAIVGMSSSSSVHKHLDKLEGMGLIERVGPQNRIKLSSLERKRKKK